MSVRVISLDEADLLCRQARKQDDAFDFFECADGNGLLAAFYRDVNRKEIDPDNNEFFSDTNINMFGQRRWRDWSQRRIRWCCYVTVADGELGDLHCCLALPGVTTQNAHSMVVGYTSDRLDRLCGRARTNDLYELWLSRCHDEAEQRASKRRRRRGITVRADAGGYEAAASMSGGTRTSTGFPPMDFKSPATIDSATQSIERMSASGQTQK